MGGELTSCVGDDALYLLCPKMKACQVFMATLNANNPCIIVCIFFWPKLFQNQVDGSETPDVLSHVLGQDELRYQEETLTPSSVTD